MLPGQIELSPLQRQAFEHLQAEGMNVLEMNAADIEFALVTLQAMRVYRNLTRTDLLTIVHSVDTD